MPLSLAIILGLVQGITEFLPVSSSGHLVVFQQFLEPILEAGKTPLAFDVFIHLATLLVTAFYLRRELWMIFSRLFGRSEASARVRHFVLLLILGTLPAAIVGLAFRGVVERAFSSLVCAAGGFLITSLLLTFAHRSQRNLGFSKQDSLAELDWPFPSLVQVVLIGCAQALAVFPGVSRSGSTIAVALILGLSTKSAVRFSFFLLLPAVFGATLLELDALASLSSNDILAYGVGFLVTMLVGWLALLALVHVVQGAKLLYFAAYTAILGVSLLLFA